MPHLTRARAIGVATALAAGAPFSAALAAPSNPSKLDPADIALLNSLLATAQQGVQMYQEAVTGKFLTPPVASALTLFGTDHAAHRDALSAAITAGGGTPVAPGTTPLVPDGTTEGAFLGEALAFERQTSAAYLGAVPAFKDRDLSKTAASILGVDTGHVALLAEALRQIPPFPTSFVT